MLAADRASPSKIKPSQTKARHKAGAVGVCRDTHIVTPLLCRCKGMLLSSDRVLPVKSLSTQYRLDIQRASLSKDIRSRCMNDYGCYDLPRAKDLLRSHTCSIFDTLKEAYSHKINIWEWEQEIADEAIDITFACWKSFRDLPMAGFSSEALLRDITQHVGHKLRSGPLQKAVVEPPIPAHYAASGIDISSESPLLTMAARGAEQQLFTPVLPQSAVPKPKEAPLPTEAASLVEQRARMLEAYVAETGASKRKIYEASNSGIHKPEFYKWRDGILPKGSATTINFERFLREKKPPIPRKKR